VRAVASAAARHLTGGVGAAFLLEIGGDCLCTDETSGRPLWPGRRFPLGDGVTGWVIRNRRSATIDDVRADSRVRSDPYPETFVRGLALVPLAPPAPAGVIAVYWDAPHRTSARELSLLRGLADSSTVALAGLRTPLALDSARLEVLDRLALAAEYRDDGSHAHTARVARSARVLAERLGLPPGEAAVIGRAAPLHDLGKLAVPEAILLKPGRLTVSEFSQIQAHTTAGAAILSGSRSAVLRRAEEIALTHHEHWDGHGYPGGLRGEAIPLSGRIVALADVFDALTHARPYKSAWSSRSALAEIRRLRGRQFDPALVDAFLEARPERLVEPIDFPLAS
jgi:HD-GYP domain-containing protein (c-di-GMP phosphodiesterase class II)